MTSLQIAQVVRLRLAAELAADRASLARLAGSLAQLGSGDPPNADADVMRALALAFQLERFYKAVESLLTRVLRTMDGDVPGGPDSHRELLRAASVPVAGLRPAVLPQETVDALRELLAFRHYARHGYDRRIGRRSDIS